MPANFTVAEFFNGIGADLTVRIGNVASIAH
jgi:hypothetical protein